MKKYKKRFSIKETNINIILDNPKYFKLAKEIILDCRAKIERFILEHPYFLSSLEPIDIESDDEIINLMLSSAFKANTGPMASVAGAISEMVVKKIDTNFIIAENGGDIALRGKDVIVALYSGNSKISGEIAFRIKNKKIYGVATSSAKIGHSISFGYADSVTVFAKSAALADAAATAICNYTIGKNKEEMINKALERADDIEGIDGVFIVIDDLVGIKGKIPELVKVDKKITFGELFDIY
ncbi:UPF0280 family protein [Methanocaldococcus indicus]|uniref:UPF0280 family protein n=1 Tax=Methanocaldococcus indicus TaxID=213231 RepID=UPI003C6D60A5